MSQILTGGAVKEHLLRNIEERCAHLVKGGVKPTLGVFRVGAKADDLSYERGILKTMATVGIQTEVVALEEETPAETAAAVFRDFCGRGDIHGILPLMPLPAPFQGLISEIPAVKDVDGLLGEGSAFVPCTPDAVIRFLDFYDIDITGKNVAVLGRSPLVGKPLAALLKARGALISVVHSQTEDPFGVVKAADVVFSAVGKARFLDGRYLRQGQTVLDIGINADPTGKKRICGDLDEHCGEELALAYSPVPGGIGEITTAVLAVHLLDACEMRR